MFNCWMDQRLEGFGGPSIYSSGKPNTRHRHPLACWYLDFIGGIDDFGK